MLMGTLLSYFLDGVFSVQVYHYYMNYASTDRRFFVYLVALAVCIEICHLSISTHTTYTALAVNFADPAALAVLPPSVAGVPFLNGAAAFCTHVFFSWRIYVFSKTLFGKMAAGLIVTTALASFSAAIASTIQYAMMQSGGLENAVLKLKNWVAVWLSGNAVCDVLISTTLVAIFMSARGSTSYTRSKGVLSMLISHTIENGMITTACALADQIAFFVLPPTNLVHLCLNGILGRLYVNVLLASLNGRESARTRLTASGGKQNTNDFRMTTGFSNASQTAQTTAQFKSFPVVAVSTQVETHADLEGKSRHEMHMYP